MKKFFKALLKMFRSNLVLKIAAVLFAVVLWSFVLSVVNPVRERELRTVPVVWQGGESLKEKGLAVPGSLSDILSSVKVRVRLKQNEVKLLTDDKAEAYIDLSIINGVGTYRLRVNAKTSYGQVIQVSPSHITVYADERHTKDVPVNVETTGSVAEGFHADDPKISPNVVRITGAKTEVDKVKSALCVVDLNGLEEGYRKTEDVTLLDENGDAVNPAMFSEAITSVVVEMNVLPVKTVSVDAEGSMIGSPVPGYEITGVETNPKTVQVVGKKELLGDIHSMQLTPFSVAGLSLDTVMLVGYAPPEGVRVLGPDKAEVTISIREITEQESYKKVKIELRNLMPGMQAAADPDSVDVTIIAGVTKLSKLLRRDVIPYVDLDGLEPGQYTLSVMFVIPEGFVIENFTPAITTVNVTVSRK